MDSEDRFARVLSEFMASAGGRGEAMDLGGEVTFEFDGMLAFIFMHPREDKAVIDVEIFALQESSSDPAQRERLLLLHQLNSITRFTHGAQAFVSVDNTLMLSREVALDGLSGERLMEILGQVLDAAADLRSAWSRLRELIVQAGQAAQGQSESDALMSSSLRA